MCYNINNLPEGIKCVSNDNEYFITFDIFNDINKPIHIELIVLT